MTSVHFSANKQKLDIILHETQNEDQIGSGCDSRDKSEN